MGSFLLFGGLRRLHQLHHLLSQPWPYPSLSSEATHHDCLVACYPTCQEHWRDMTPPLTLILGMWCLTIRMSTNVTIPIFGLVMNLIRILGIWDVYIWFIFKNLIRVIFFQDILWFVSKKYISIFQLTCIINTKTII